MSGKQSEQCLRKRVQGAHPGGSNVEEPPVHSRNAIRSSGAVVFRVFLRAILGAAGAMLVSAASIAEQRPVGSALTEMRPEADPGQYPRGPAEPASGKGLPESGFEGSERKHCRLRYRLECAGHLSDCQCGTGDPFWSSSRLHRGRRASRDLRDRRRQEAPHLRGREACGAHPDKRGGNRGLLQCWGSDLQRRYCGPDRSHTGVGQHGRRLGRGRRRRRGLQQRDLDLERECFGNGKQGRLRSKARRRWRDSEQRHADPEWREFGIGEHHDG